jgi:hypothetical protein
MNENMNGQVPQVPVEPAVQQPVAPQPMMQQPPMQQPMMQGQVTPGATQPAFNMNNVKDKFNGMDKEKTLKMAGMICGILILIGVFLPYMSIEFLGYKTTASIWDSEMKVYRLVMILFAAITVLTYFFQKAKPLALVAAGMAFGFVITIYDASEKLEGTGFGFWLLVLGSIGLIAVAVMENLDEIKSIFGKTNTPSPIPGMAQPAPTFAAAAQPVNPVAPVIQNVEVCNHCGQPKKNPADQFCQSCGQRY